MTWGAIGSAAVGVVGSAVIGSGSSNTNGGAGTQTTSKAPWAMAQPWLMNNLAQGQNLQQAYTAQPFSQLQNQAYQNQGNQSAYMRNLTPSLLEQLSNQPVGFDRANPNARPTAFNFNGTGSPGGAPSSGGGLLGMLGGSGAQPMNLAQSTPQVQQPQQEQGTFTNQSDVLNGLNMSGLGGIAGLIGTGGYGTWKYGQAVPQPGTQAYRDYSAYFTNGGADPNNLYGRGAPAQVNNLWGGTSSGSGIGSSAPTGNDY